MRFFFQYPPPFQAISHKEDMKESKAHNAGGIKGFLGGPE